MADNEEYFPRGGKKPTIPQFKQSGNFLGAPEKIDKKKKRQKKKSEDDDGYLSDEIVETQVEQSYKNCATGISYKTVKEGLLILARVRQVLETKVNLSLPSRLYGTVMACHVSEPYNKLLEDYVNDKIDQVRELSTMFRPGQYVAAKVLEVKDDLVMMSMMPQHINSSKTHAEVRKGILLQAAVSSVEDHGYVMDVGIANTRAFLPKSDTNPEMELDVGMLTWCCVKSMTPSPDNTVVTLSNQLEELQKAVLKRKTNTPLLPGTSLEFTVDKPLDNGIEGHVFADTTAYVQRAHADKVKGKKPTLGQRIRARLLYVMPTRNEPFLLMKDIFATTHPDLDAEQTLKEGEIVQEAQVIKIVGRWIQFKLGGGCIGIMSMNRLQVDEDLTDADVVAKSYPIGSTHSVRVLAYNLSDYVYSVSDRASLLSERYFSRDDVRVGDIVDATVAQVNAHVLLNVGRLTGFVAHTHLTDAGVFIDPKKASTTKLPKKKLKVGQSVKARVLSVDPEKGIQLTLKPSLLSPDLEVLGSYEDACVGKSYTGVIKYIKNYILVSFFNNVMAFVHRQYVTKEPIENLADAFHLGQIINCTILRVDKKNKKMTGSLTTPAFWNQKKREILKRKPSDGEKALPTKKAKSDDDEVDTRKKDKKKKSDKKEDESNEPLETKKKKKDKKMAEKAVDDKEDEQEQKRKERKRKKEKKLPEESIVETNEASESDAIETDIQSDEILTPQDLGLIDMSDCDTPKKYKHRVVSIMKTIKAKEKRIERIDNKIAKIEEKGLNAKNKKFHTAMHSEKLVIQERIKLMTEALDVAKEQLKILGEDKVNTEYKIKEKEAKKVKKEENKKRKETKKREEAKQGKDAKKDRKVKEEAGDNENSVDQDTLNLLNIKAENSVPLLDVPSVKDFWSTETETNNVQDDESSSSDDDEEKDQPKKKRKKLSTAEKLSKLREEEERVRRLERRAAESDAQPQSCEQFERALLAHPDSSQLWIAYMAFHLQATEIDKARAVARKAINTINFREEQEKLNVWVALINVENRFGTKETQQKTLEEALQMNDTFKVHSKLLDIYVETGKQAELSSLVDLMMRKYRKDPTVYTLCGAACFKIGLVDKARHAMQKAITVLEKKEHVNVLVRFAVLERASGSAERGEALLEQVLGVYPQRVDVCQLLADALAKDGHVERVRQLMERMTSQSIPARKMKVLFKKWIEIEERIGDAEHAEKIRQRALDYIDKAKF